MSFLIVLSVWIVCFFVVSLFIVALDEIDAPIFTPIVRLLRRVC